MNASNANATWIVPSILVGHLAGVRAIRISPRKVHVEMLVTARKFPRKLLPQTLPADYIALALLVLPIARREGVEVNSLL